MLHLDGGQGSKELALCPLCLLSPDGQHESSCPTRLPVTFTDVLGHRVIDCSLFNDNEDLSLESRNAPS